MDNDGIDGLIAATFDQSAAPEDLSQSPPVEQDFSATEDLQAPEYGDVPDQPEVSAPEDGIAAPDAGTAPAPDWGEQFAAFQQDLPNLLSAQIQQAVLPYQQQAQQQQQQFAALAQYLAQQQQRALQAQQQQRAQAEQSAFLEQIADAEPNEQIARLVAYFDQRQAQRDEAARLERENFNRQFATYQQQQAALQREQESIGHVARHWQAQYGLTDEEAQQLLSAPDPYQMGMQAQNIAYNRHLSSLNERIEHLTKSVSVQQRVASGVDRAGNTVGSTRGPRRLEDAKDDDELMDILLNGG